jgi:hypothetical protein
LKVMEYVTQQYRQVVQTHADIGPARAEREALQIYIAKIDTLIAIGKWNPQDFLNYLTVQQQLATAIATEYQAIANYNNALATFEFAKGTIKQYNNVSVGEGPLPSWAQKKATDHLKARDNAIKIRERDVSESGQTSPSSVGGQPVGPAVGTGFSSELPPFADKKWEDPASLPDYPERKPMPQPVLPPGVGSGVRSWPAPGEPTLPSQPPAQILSQPFAPQLPLSTSAAPPAPQKPQPPAMPPYQMPSLPQPPASTGASTAPAVSAEAYFRPAGTASMPSRGTDGPGGFVPSTTVPSVSPGAMPALPTGSGMNPLPIPPVGKTTLPAPTVSTENVQFGPAGSVPPFGGQPGGR